MILHPSQYELRNSSVFFVVGSHSLSNQMLPLRAGPFNLSLIHNHLRAFEIKAKPDMLHACPGQRIDDTLSVFSIEHEKPSAACADEFSTERAIPHREAIPFVYF